MPTAPGDTQQRGVPLPTGIYDAATSRKGMRWSPAGDYVVITRADRARWGRDGELPTGRVFGSFKRSLNAPRQNRWGICYLAVKVPGVPETCYEVTLWHPWLRKGDFGAARRMETAPVDAAAALQSALDGGEIPQEVKDAEAKAVRAPRRGAGASAPPAGGASSTARLASLGGARPIHVTLHTGGHSLGDALAAAAAAAAAPAVMAAAAPSTGAGDAHAVAQGQAMGTAVALTPAAAMWPPPTVPVPASSLIPGAVPFLLAQEEDSDMEDSSSQWGLGLPSALAPSPTSFYTHSAFPELEHVGAWAQGSLVPQNGGAVG